MEEKEKEKKKYSLLSMDCHLWPASILSLAFNIILKVAVLKLGDKARSPLVVVEKSLFHDRGCGGFGGAVGYRLMTSGTDLYSRIEAAKQGTPQLYDISSNTPLPPPQEKSSREQ